MPKYRVTSPSGETFEITAPEGASEAQVMEYAQQNMQSGKPAAPQSPASLPTHDGAPVIEVNGTAADLPKSDAPKDVPVLEGLGMGAARGGKDFLDSLAYLAPKGLQQVTSLGGLAPNPVSNFFGSEAKRVSDMNQAGLDEFKRDYGDSTAATIGRVAGNVGTAFLPGMGQMSLASKANDLWKAGKFAQSLAAAGGLGAAQGVALGTQTENDDAIKNALIGALGGAAGQGISGLASNAIAKRAAAGGNSTNVLRDAAAKQARDAGYVIPPSQTNPTLTNRLLEGTAGKISTAQRASRANEQVTNDLVARALGTTPDQLTPQGLASIRAQAGQAYDALGRIGNITPDAQFLSDVSSLGANSRSVNQAFPGLGGNQVDDLIAQLTANQGPLPASAAVDALKKLRFDASANLRNAIDPSKMEIGKAQKGAAKALESLFERELGASGQTDLLDAFRNARQQIARSHTVEKALGADGTVSAPALAAALKKGAPLTGELRTVAETGRAFPKAVQSLGNQSVLPISPLDWIAGAGLSGAGVLSGNPALAGLAAVRPAVRAGILSKPYQQMMGAPNYDPAILARLFASKVNGAPVLPLTAAPALTQQ